MKHRVVGYALVSRGTLDSTIVHPREVFRAALMASAAPICLVHNHPSGDPRPSADDDLLTLRMVACGDLMGIEVVDHVVVGEHGYFSYRKAGRLECLQRPWRREASNRRLARHGNAGRHADTNIVRLDSSVLTCAVEARQ